MTKFIKEQMNIRITKRTSILILLLLATFIISACGGKKATPTGQGEAQKTEEQIAEEARKKAEEEAKRKAEEEAKRKAEEEARKKAEEEAKRKAEEEAKRKAAILAAPIEEEPVVELNLAKIYFGYDQFELTDESKSSIEESYEWIQENSKVKILIAGHADERGSEEYNLGLGERRAKAVINYLISLGADSNQFELISFGEERPQIEGNTEKEWSQNRRVEFSKY